MKQKSVWFSHGCQQVDTGSEEKGGRVELNCKNTKEHSWAILLGFFFRSKEKKYSRYILYKKENSIQFHKSMYEMKMHS